MMYRSKIRGITGTTETALFGENDLNARKRDPVIPIWENQGVRIFIYSGG